MFELNFRGRGLWIGLLSIWVGIFFPRALHARDSDLGNIFEMSLEELLALPVDLATAAKTEARQQPASVTVITREEISGLGARYLIDILEQIPGVSQGVDVFGVTSLIFRGHWAHEGKIALFIDDLPVNDLMYGTLNMARHYPAAQIDRVEVIRGAGTAKYGGNAQLAVIRVYTTEATGNAVTAQLTSDKVNHTSRGRSALITATGIEGDLKWVLSSHFSDVAWSGETWRDNSNGAHDLAEESGINTFNLINKLDWRGFHFRLLWDRYESQTPHKHGDSRPGETVEFDSINLSLAYDFYLSEKFTLTPKYTYRSQEDWWISRDPAVNPISDFHLPAEKHFANLDLLYDSSFWSYLTGVEYSTEEGRAESAGGFGVPSETYFNGKGQVRYHNIAAYGQAEIPLNNYLLSLGARYNHHSFSGNSFVPRIGLVYNQPTWGIKGGYGQAFRDPDIDTINSSDLNGVTIEAEKTQQYELEFSWMPVESLAGSMALFYIENKNPIIYSSNGIDFSYSNNDKSSTQGLETSWMFQRDDYRVTAGYSFYTAVDTPTPYLIPQNSQQHLGAPQHKITLAADYRFPGNRWALMPALVWYSSCYAYDFESGASDPDGDEISSQKLASKTFVNLTARYTRNEWHIDLGVTDLFDQVRVYPQPYQDASTPYLGPGRTLFMTLSLDLGL